MEAWDCLSPCRAPRWSNLLLKSRLTRELPGHSIFQKQAGNPSQRTIGSSTLSPRYGSGLDSLPPTLLKADGDELAYLHSGCLCLWSLNEKTFVQTRFLTQRHDPTRLWGRHPVLELPIYALPSFETAGLQSASDEEIEEIRRVREAGFRQQLLPSAHDPVCALGTEDAKTPEALTKSGALDKLLEKKKDQSLETLRDWGCIRDVHVRPPGFQSGPLKQLNCSLNVIVELETPSVAPAWTLLSLVDKKAFLLLTIMDPLERFVKSCAEASGLVLKPKWGKSRPFRLFQRDYDHCPTEVRFLWDLLDSLHSPPAENASAGPSLLLQFRAGLPVGTFQPTSDLTIQRVGDLTRQLSSLLSGDFDSRSKTHFILSTKYAETPDLSGYLDDSRGLWVGRLNESQSRDLLSPSEQQTAKLLPSVPPEALREPPEFRGKLAIEVRVVKERGKLQSGAGGKTNSQQAVEPEKVEGGGFKKRKRREDEKEVQNSSWLQRRESRSGAEFFLPLLNVPSGTDCAYRGEETKEPVPVKEEMSD
uniref:Uncharacterized protein n=1 Tax=Chromera velia CCMP2878 TaxID=1169474 RepID=A0A0G4FHD6_9ALVE|eukprot:Cvel_16859.t1-p1 / transcript=Cvel_16859.t1 / gene=Cvel_16859 / organism=Chromera_velia_CCMP2878 / gene_product=hypothetical protein / transcript_product=hypothetical protein / location=Cvel_scaffold1318:27319-30259(-) / protein_length=531 / sequence_SO=supercontig / SO=protein_coding / is_pseudo=false